MKFEVGKPYKLLAIEWRENWEFDNPSALLEPIFRDFSDGQELDNIFEDMCIDICMSIEADKEIVQSQPARYVDLYNGVKYLKRVAREALNGKEFPKKNYRAEEMIVEFYWVTDTRHDSVVEWKTVYA
jgi:hypothetical protein